MSAMGSSEMGQVNVTINGRVYRMACEDGQEKHLHDLAARLDRTISGLKDGFGEIGDQRLTVMAAIMSMDELIEAERRIAGLEAEIRALRQSEAAGSQSLVANERDFARRIGEAAEKIEQLAAALTSTKPAN
jgi:cell division protein ZapA